MSGGHLCEAEAPTEATAETAAVVPYLKDMIGLNMLADIGNGTVNIMKINNRKPITTQSYTEKMGDSPRCGEMSRSDRGDGHRLGVNQCVKAASNAMMNKLSVTVDETIIQSMIRYGKADIDCEYADVLRQAIAEYAEDIFALLRKYEYDPIVTKSISRFARNTVDCLEYIRELKLLGIGVMFEKENINTMTMNSEFIISLYGSFAQAESESISKNITWGVEKSFKEGKVKYSLDKMLGFRRGEDGKPIIVEEEAEIVRYIYKLYIDGLSLKRIARRLRDEGVKKWNGTTDWTAVTVYGILKNEKYAGDAVLQKTYTVDCILHKQMKNNGEKDKYIVYDCHPAIISRDTYNRVQQELARRGSIRKRSDKTETEQGHYASKYALSDILICGECGTAYCRVTWTSHGHKLVVWRCINRLDHGSKYCKNSPSINEEKLQTAIVDALNSAYADGEKLMEEMKRHTFYLIAL